MTHASLFSGIGGPEVAATMLGWDNLFHCEINDFGRKILDYWYPNSKSYEDITKTDFSEWRGKVDVLTGGFPCQPFSYAGKRRGADDDRYLWPFMFKAIDQIRPTWVVAENVAGITTMVEQGEVSEMGGQASIFEEVDGLHRYRLAETFTLQRICDDLEGHGYSVHPVLVPACSVGAPHRRDRVFIVARRVTTDSNFGYDGGNAGENESESGKERIQERHEIRELGQPNQVRRESERNASSDTDCAGQLSSVKQGGRERETMDGERKREPLNGIERLGYAPPSSNTDSRRVRGFHSDGELCEERNNKKPFANTCGDAFSDTSCSGAGAPGESGCSERERRRDDVEPEERGESSEWSYGFYELLRHTSDAESEQSGRCQLGQPGSGKPKQSEFGRRGGEDDAERHTADTYSQRPDKPVFATEPSQPQRFDCKENNKCGIAGLGRWDTFPTVSPVHRGNDGIPFDVDSLSIPFTKWRTESLKAYGNAIVPQVMYEIFRAIELVEKETN